ncbi:hypothetical protein BSKO_08582 [Bryopsis sp. KO-2023]|nr:hypothetical protein BSKO_08582 [Bryopsis sp. KO-2023]
MLHEVNADLNTTRFLAGPAIQWTRILLVSVQIREEGKVPIITCSSHSSTLLCCQLVKRKKISKSSHLANDEIFPWV